MSIKNQLALAMCAGAIAGVLWQKAIDKHNMPKCDSYYGDKIHRQQQHYRCSDGRLSTHPDYCSDDDIVR